MQNIKEFTVAFLIVVFACFIGVALFQLVLTSLDKSEVVSCLKLAEQAQEFGGFYLTDWQAEMCEAHNIVINAEVK